MNRTVSLSLRIFGLAVAAWALGGSSTAQAVVGALASLESVPPAAASTLPLPLALMDTPSAGAEPSSSARLP